MAATKARMVSLVGNTEIENLTLVSDFFTDVQIIDGDYKYVLECFKSMVNWLNGYPVDRVAKILRGAHGVCSFSGVEGYKARIYFMIDESLSNEELLVMECMDHKKPEFHIEKCYNVLNELKRGNPKIKRVSLDKNTLNKSHVPGDIDMSALIAELSSASMLVEQPLPSLILPPEDFSMPPPSPTAISFKVLKEEAAFMKKPPEAKPPKGPPFFFDPDADTRKSKKGKQQEDKAPKRKRKTREKDQEDEADELSISKALPEDKEDPTMFRDAPPPPKPPPTPFDTKGEGKRPGKKPKKG